MNLARTTAKGFGYPDIPMVVVPHPFETLPLETVHKIAEEKVDEIVAQLTKSQEKILPA